MHENFLAMEQEKRDRIINAAMSEFSAKGFKNASTNEIVKKAGISKGALFYHFATKQDLYVFLYNYGINFFIKMAEPHIKEMPTDIFERLIAFSALKLEIASKHHDLANFMVSVYTDDSCEGNGLYIKEVDRISVVFQKIMHDGIDLTKFRTDIDMTKVYQILWWVLEGYALSKQKVFDMASFNNSDSLKVLTDEMEAYFVILKKSFYKEEYLT